MPFRYSLFVLAAASVIGFAGCEKETANTSVTFFTDYCDDASVWELQSEGSKSSARLSGDRIRIEAERVFAEDTAWASAYIDFEEYVPNPEELTRICMEIGITGFVHQQQFQGFSFQDMNFRLYAGDRYITLKNQHFSPQASQLLVCFNTELRDGTISSIDGGEVTEHSRVLTTKPSDDYRWGFELYAWSGRDGQGLQLVNLDYVEVYTY